MSTLERAPLARGPSQTHLEGAVVVNFLIRIVGERFARRIENGSRAGAAAGAFLAGAAGAGIAFALNARELLDTYRNAIYLILGIPLALAGALLGAAFGPTNPVPDGRGGLRITNYNRAAVPLAIALGITALSAGLLLVPDDSSPATQPTPPTAADRLIAFGVLPIAALGCMVWAWNTVWSVQVGPVITVRRLACASRHGRRDLRHWEFAVEASSPTQEPFAGSAELHLFFEDETRAAILLDGPTSAAAVRALAVWPPSPTRAGWLPRHGTV